MRINLNNKMEKELVQFFFLNLKIKMGDYWKKFKLPNIGENWCWASIYFQQYLMGRVWTKKIICETQ